MWVLPQSDIWGCSFPLTVAPSRCCVWVWLPARLIHVSAVCHVFSVLSMLLFRESNFSLSRSLNVPTASSVKLVHTQDPLLLCPLPLSCRNWGWLLVFCVASSFPSCLSSTSRCNSSHFYFLCRVGCDVIEKGTGLPKSSPWLGGAAKVCWGACTQEEKQGVLHSE